MGKDWCFKNIIGNGKIIMSKLFYGLCDLANSTYTMIGIIFLMSTYFLNQIFSNAQIGGTYWQWIVGFCGIVIIISRLFIGAQINKKLKRNYLIHTASLFDPLLCCWKYTKEAPTAA